MTKTQLADKWRSRADTLREVLQGLRSVNAVSADLEEMTLVKAIILDECAWELEMLDDDTSQFDDLLHYDPSKDEK